MIPDSYITELRLRAVRELPWPIPVLVVGMTDEDFDRLAAASTEDYWRVLNAIVRRIELRTTDEESA